MRDVREGRRTSVGARTGLLAALVTVVIAACSRPPVAVAVHNASAADFYLRVRWDYGEVHVLRSPAHTDAEIVSAQAGEPPATIELLRPDCSVVGSWRDQSGGMITIDPAGSTSFGPIPEEEPGLPSMDEVAACGNTQFSAGSASPAVAGRGPVPRPASTSPGTISRPMPLVWGGSARSRLALEIVDGPAMRPWLD